MKKRYRIEVKDNELYLYEILTEKDIARKVKEAVKKYVDRTGNEPKVFTGRFKLPRILKDGKEIDLSKEFKGAKMVVEFVGVIPYLPYIDVRGDGKVKFIHFPEKEMLLVADPSDRERIYVIHSLRLTEEGLKDEE